MKLEIISYNETLRTAWDDLVNNSVNGTFLHERSFFDHNPLNKIDDHSFLYYKKNKVIGIFPAVFYTKEGKNILNSHLRSTYGGFIVNKETGVEEAIEMVERLIEEAKRINTHEIVVRNPFRIFHQNNCDETDYSMWYHGFKIKARELEVVIKLDEKHLIESHYDDSTKRNIKKGRKSLIVEESNDYEVYWKILITNLENKHNAKPTHDFDSFQILLNKIGKEKIKLFTAKLDKRIVAGIVLFLVNKTALHAQYIASDLSFQELRPLDFLIDEIVNWGLANGFKFFNLGTANEDGGKRINYGLFRFKEGFGARCVLRETMALTIK